MGTYGAPTVGTMVMPAAASTIMQTGTSTVMPAMASNTIMPGAPTYAFQGVQNVMMPGAVHEVAYPALQSHQAAGFDGTNSMAMQSQQFNLEAQPAMSSTVMAPATASMAMPAVETDFAPAPVEPMMQPPTSSSKSSSKKSSSKKDSKKSSKKKVSSKKKEK